MQRHYSLSILSLRFVLVLSLVTLTVHMPDITNKFFDRSSFLCHVFMPMAMQLITAIVAAIVVLFSVGRALKILVLRFRVAVVAHQIVTEILV